MPDLTVHLLLDPREGHLRLGGILVSLSWDGGWGSNFLGEFTRTGTHPKRLLRARDVATADSREQNEESVSGDSIEINPSK